MRIQASINRRKITNSSNDILFAGLMVSTISSYEN